MGTTTRTVTRQVEIEVPTFQPKRAKEALPLVGDTELLDKAVGVISVNWEGEADQVIMAKPLDVPTGLFDPVDKGGYSVFGIDAKGSVIFGMARYDGDHRAKNELEQEPHYHIAARNCARSY